MNRLKKASAGLAYAISSLFEGANSSKDRRSGATTPRDSKYDLTRWSRLKLVAEARRLYANDGLTRGAIRDLAQYSVGQGLVPQAQSGNDAFNEAAEAYWREWCKIADVTGRHPFNRIQRLLSIAIDRDGDIGILLTRTAGGWPQIQLIESHRIGSDDAVSPADGWVDGVKFNEAGRPISFRIIEGDLLTGTKTYRDVPASDFIHLFDAERSDQARGITALYHAINTLADKKDIIDFEKIAVKRNSSIWAKMKTPAGAAGNPDWDEEEENIEGRKVVFKKAQGGELKIVGSDEDMEAWESNRPSPAFTGFLEFIIRDVAAGLGVPYEFIWNPEKLGGTGNRFVLAKAQRRFAERQDLLVSMVLNRLWFWVISVGIKRGDLVLPRKDLPVWKVSWQMPAELTVDAGRDANSDREDVKMGLMTEAEHFGRRGLDWFEARRQKEAEVDDLLVRAKALAEKHKIELNVALTLLQQSTPNGITLQVQSNGSKPDQKNEEEKAA